MKKAVAIAIAIFVVFVGGVLVFGFIKKQQAENSVSNTPANNSSSTNPLDESQSTAANAPQPSTPTTYTTAQVATHSKASDCWLIISSKVYNITNFLDQHPGGTDVILPYCGKDATKAFDTQGGRRNGHSSSARQQLAEFQVGTLK